MSMFPLYIYMRARRAEQGIYIYVLILPTHDMNSVREEKTEYLRQPALSYTRNAPNKPISSR